MRRLIAPATLVAALFLTWPAFAAGSDKDTAPKGGNAHPAAAAVKGSAKTAPGVTAQSDGHAAPVTPASKVKIIKRLGPKPAAAAQDAAQPHDSTPASAEGHRDAHAADTSAAGAKGSAAPKSTGAKKDAPAPRGDHQPSAEGTHTPEGTHTKAAEKEAGKATAHVDDHETPDADTEPAGAGTRRARRSGKSAPHASEGGHGEARPSAGHGTETGASLRAARMAKRAAGKAPAAAHAAAEAPVAAPATNPRTPGASTQARALAPVASPRPPAIGRRAPAATAARAPLTPTAKPATPWRQLEWSGSWVALDWDAAHWVALSWDGDSPENGAHLAGGATPAPRPPTQQ